MKDKLKKNWSYIAAPLAAVLLVLFVYLIKGIFPFGTSSIIEADLGQGYIPVFYNMHDVLRGDGGIFWNFSLGAGSNFYGSFVLNALFSISTLQFGLVPREGLINFVNILLLLKIFFLALSSVFVFKKIFKNVGEVYITLFGILYALSGYVILSYHNIVWMDSLIVFPFFILACKHLLDTGEAKWFVLTLALELILSYYISFMLLMMIVFVGAVGVVFYAPKELRKKISMKILLGTILALAISAFAFLPSFTQSQASMRLSNVVTSKSLENPELYTKLNFYMCAALPIFLYILNVYKCFKEDKRKALFWIFAIIFPIMGLFLEPINKMWHAGSYNSFPYRYGFIPLFILSLGSLSYLNNREKESKSKDKRDLILLGLSVLIFVIISVLVAKFSNDIMTYEIFRGLYDKKIFLNLSIIFILYLVIIEMCTFIKNRRLEMILLCFFTISQIFTSAFWFIGLDNKYISHVEHKDEIIKYENDIYQNFKLDHENKLDRYRDTTASFEENYPYILNVPSISSWIHIITQDQADLHKALGYSTRYTRVQDLDGTLFSDSMYRIRYLFTNEDVTLNNKLYKLLETHNGLNLYEKKVLPFGIINKNTKLEDFNGNPFSYQNMVYRNMLEKNKDIINVLNTKPQIKDGKAIYEFKVSNESELYLYTSEAYIISYITVNGENVKIPVIDNKNNTFYSSSSNNGVVLLGTFEGNVKVELTLNPGKSVNLDEIYLGYTSIDDYLEYLNSFDYKTKAKTFKNGLEIKVNGNKDEYLLVPITYNDGWSATVNGKDVNPKKYMINFMNIPLEDGENVIVMKFIPPRFKLSVIISIVSLAILVLFSFLNKKFKIDNNKIICYLFTGIAILVYLVFLYKIYIGVLF